jgi:hypothetical protein
MVLQYDELERIWKEAIASWFKAFCRHLPEGLREQRKTCQGSQFLDQDFNLGSPGYEASVPTTRYFSQKKFIVYSVHINLTQVYAHVTS